MTTSAQVARSPAYALQIPLTAGLTSSPARAYPVLAPAATSSLDARSATQSSADAPRRHQRPPVRAPRVGPARSRANRRGGRSPRAAAPAPAGPGRPRRGAPARRSSAARSRAGAPRPAPAPGRRAPERRSKARASARPAFGTSKKTLGSSRSNSAVWVSFAASPERALEGGCPDRPVHDGLELRRQGPRRTPSSGGAATDTSCAIYASNRVVVQRGHRAIRERVLVEHLAPNVRQHPAGQSQHHPQQQHQHARGSPAHGTHPGEAGSASRGALRARRARPSARRRPCTRSSTWTSRSRPSGSARRGGAAPVRTRTARPER